MRYSRYLWVFSLTLLLTLALYAQDSEPVYKLRVDVPVVMLEAIVRDANARPQVQLRQSDFEIYEDGQPQEILYFGPAETPRSILLAFDVTGVMDEQGPFMVQAMNLFLANLREQDRIAVGAIGPEFEMLMNFRTYEKGKSLTINLPKERRGSNLYESLSMAARRFNKENGRKAMIIMTDGRETFMFNETMRLGMVQNIADDSDFQKWLKDARKAGIPYYFMALDTDPRYMGRWDYEYSYLKDPAGYMRTAQYANGRRSPRLADEYLAGVRLRLEKLADATGGAVIYPTSMEGVIGMYARIAIELGYSYSLGYAPKSPVDDGKFRKLEVRVKDTTLRVSQSRMGYGVDATAAKK
jgi:VWFA-related protein